MLGPLIIDISGPQLSAEDREVLCHPLVGGVIFFERHYQSYEQIQQLMSEVKNLRTPPLLLCVDQEGGPVQRFHESFTSLPSLRTLGQLYDCDPKQALAVTHDVAWLMATELLSIGVDLSFAPVVDLDRNINPCLRHRCFHHDPKVVAQLAVQFSRGMLDAGMKAIAKHFPGHGGVSQDTHLVPAYDKRSLNEVNASDLLPFKNLIQQNIAAMMVGHVTFPEVDECPASYSKQWIDTILRQQLGFKGLVFSDDLSMLGAYHEHGKQLTISDRAHHALEAGCDMILICNNRHDVITAIDSLSKQNYQNSNLQRYASSMYGKQNANGHNSELLSMQTAVKNTIRSLIEAEYD